MKHPSSIYGVSRSALLLLAVLVLLSGKSLAQDTIRVMHYNLLNYGVTTGFCNNNNNNIDVKNAALQKIIAYASPDIFTVNEISGDVAVHEMLLDSVLEKVFPGRYARAGFSNLNNSYIVNELYYDVSKILLLEANGIFCDVRDADAYSLGILPQSVTDDTSYLRCFVTHLKAGSGSGDQQDRAAMVSDILNYLSNQGYTGNNLILGDFNLKKSSETAWYNLTQFPNAAVRFYDPVNAAGSWTSNTTYAWLHSQSTHSNNNGCAASGGMDDRFDFIMSSLALMNGIEGLQYAAGSYRTIGQDGDRYNASVINPPNNDVPADVAEALYDMSDHLPIMVGLEYGSETGLSELAVGSFWTLMPAREHITLFSNLPFQKSSASIYTLDGRLIGREDIPQGETMHTFSVKLQPGFFLVHLSSKNQEVLIKAVVN